MEESSREGFVFVSVLRPMRLRRQDNFKSTSPAKMPRQAYSHLIIITRP